MKAWGVLLDDFPWQLEAGNSSFSFTNLSCLEPLLEPLLTMFMFLILICMLEMFEIMGVGFWIIL